MRRTEHVLASGETGPIGVIAAGLPETEAAAVRVAGDLALETDAHVYVVHLSGAEGLAQVGAARERGARVLAETCPQYLFLTDDALRQPAETAQDFLCTPPVRTDADRCSLWEGLAVGDLDAVATDHCPFTTADRRRGSSRTAGVTSPRSPAAPRRRNASRARLPGVRDGRLSFERWVEVMSVTPARLFCLSDRKGRLEPGLDADVVVWTRTRPSGSTPARSTCAPTTARTRR